MNRKNLPIVGVLLALLYVAWRVFLIFHRVFDTDELEHSHAAWCIQQGYVIYKDFFEHHGPALASLLSPVSALTQDPIRALIASRFIVLAAAVAMAGVVLLSVRAWARPAAMVAGVIALVSWPPFAIHALEIRPDGFTGLCLVIALFLALSRDTTRWKSMGLGFALGVGFLFSPKVAYAGAGILAGWLIQERPSWRMVGACAIGFVIPVALESVYFLSLGAGRAAFDNFWLFNWHFRAHFSPWPILLQNFKSNPFILILWAYGLVCARKSWPFTLSALGGMVGFLLLPVPYSQYGLLFAPWIAIGVVYAWQASGERLLSRLLLAGCVVSAIWLEIKLGRQSNHDQVAEIRCVHAHTRPTDRILDIWTGVPLFRPHAHYYWFLHDEIRIMLNPVELEKSLRMTLQSLDCQGLIWGYNFNRLPESVRAVARQYYAPQKGCERLWLRKVR